MKGDGMKQEIEMLIRKKQSHLKKAYSRHSKVNKTSYKWTLTLSRALKNCELRILIENITCNKQKEAKRIMKFNFH